MKYDFNLEDNRVNLVFDYRLKESKNVELMFLDNIDNMWYCGGLFAMVRFVAVLDGEEVYAEFQCKRCEDNTFRFNFVDDNVDVFVKPKNYYDFAI